MRPGVVAVAGLALSASAAAITAANTPADTAVLAASGRALMVAVPVAVGLYAWRRSPDERFGPLLIAAGFAWFMTTLSESGNEVAYGVGRVSGWLVEVGLIYLVLAFPSGRLTNRTDRWLVWLAVALVALLYVPVALIVESFPVPSPYASCQGGCPDNAFLVLAAEPAFVDSLLRPGRELLTVLLFAAVTLRLGRRVQQATPLMSRTLVPVLGVAAARVTVLAVALGIRAADAHAAVLRPLSWTIALALPAMAAAFLVGLLRWRLNVADALQELGLRVRHTLTHAEFRDTLARTLGDPALEVAYPLAGRGGEWVDAESRPVELPAPASGRCVTEVRSEGRLVAAIVHDEALRGQEEFVAAAASYALVALENRRLGARVASALGDARESRARILATADHERRRIERDLHDGAQQRLVALRIQLELLEELLEHQPEQVRQKLHTLEGDVEGTLDSIRSLARGVYPALLASGGLADALWSAARANPIPATVQLDGAGRYPTEVESAVYFCCLEALQNVAKHAEGAHAITISLVQDDELHFEVRDDGAGFDPVATPAGTGLTNMRDRLAAIGGGVTVHSHPGEGTVVAGTVPVVALEP